MHRFPLALSFAYLLRNFGTNVVVDVGERRLAVELLAYLLFQLLSSNKREPIFEVPQAPRNENSNS